MSTTTNFALNKPTVGGDENTWGGLTNDNWDDVDNLLRIAMPAGGIIMWVGSIASIPTGWLLCDGTFGTPDLRDRFIVGAGSGYTVGEQGGANNVTLTGANLPSHTHSFSATTGGHSVDHTHSGTTDAAGAHSHFVARNTAVGADYTPNLTGAGAVSWGNNTTGIFEGYNLRNTDAGPANVGPTNTDGTHTHSFTTGGTSSDHTHTVSGTTGATGSGTAHENRPPFFALAYIMKAA